MATHCFIPLLGKRLRVTPLDSCGNVPTAAEYVATDGFVTVTLSSEVEEGTEIIVRKASGALCVNEKMADSFKRFTVEIDFCGVNPSLLSIVSNAVPYEDGSGDVIGFTVPEGEIAKWFSLELWTGLSGAVCEPGAEEASGYMLLPFVVAGVLGDIEIGGEDAITFSLTGAATKGGNNWGTGRYNVVRDDEGAPAPLAVAVDPFDHLLLIDTSLAPPPEACDPAPVPALPGGGGA
ncbi:major tail protein [Microbacterium phage Cressida]|uniref:Major tail protein n=1 Tax=Microbacterium phage Cressida TaxID=2591216 RepID=A0A514DI30_9CAUD|nr:major tail protein [Microbacterium phage Cressida]QDH93269.1 major tail protein [Microbacterium phage Cressida]